MLNPIAFGVIFHARRRKMGQHCKCRSGCSWDISATLAAYSVLWLMFVVLLCVIPAGGIDLTDVQHLNLAVQVISIHLLITLSYFGHLSTRWRSSARTSRRIAHSYFWRLFFVWFSVMLSRSRPGRSRLRPWDPRPRPYKFGQISVEISKKIYVLTYTSGVLTLVRRSVFCHAIGGSGESATPLTQVCIKARPRGLHRCRFLII